MTKISIIIPLRNAQNWIGAALTSLKNQSYADFEAIIVDDGSTDESATIAAKFCDEDGRFILVRQPQGGVSIARNLGIDKATGDWIAFLDADDMLREDALATLVDLQTKTGADIVAARYLRTRTPEKEISFDPGNALYQSPNAFAHFSTLDSDEAIRIGLYQKRILNSPGGVLYRKTIFEDGLRFRNCRYEDLDFFYRAFEKAAKICVSDAIVYLYRDCPGSFINSWTARRLDALSVTDEICRHFKLRADERLLRAADDRRFAAHFNMLLEMTRRNVENPAQINRCIRVIRELRKAELADPDVRLKNKLGALLSYLGSPAIKLLCKLSR